MNEQTLELQIKTTAEGAISSVKVLNNNLKTMDSNVNKVSSNVNKLGKAFSFGALYVGMKRLTTQFTDWMNLAIDRTEQLNLFNVVFKNVEENGKKVFSELGKEATNFQYKLNEAFGTNFTDTTKYQALFQSMGQNVGIADKYSAIMSETMTKLTYDLGSLYNKSEKDIAEALRAGVYAGQTKPLRAYGVDVTQTSLTPIAESLGITDRSVKEMSQAEKEILKYIATLRQAQVAMGDYANTIESPANQTKVFKNTLVEAKVALTSLFIGTFAKILPYANAILMVIKEVSKAIATMFGIKISDYNTGIASQADAYEGLEDSIDGATDSAKKLKREVLSFDQIHNINDKDDSSGSGTSGVTGGIDQRLLDAIAGYDNGMDKVRMKATEIRDKIMEWLGFTKKINPITGETYFEYQGIDKTLSNLWKSFKGLSTEGKILVGLGLYAGATKLLGIGKSLITTLGSSGLVKVLKSLISPATSLLKWATLGVQVNGNLTSGLKEGINAWRTEEGIIDKTTGKLNGFTGVMNGAKVALKGFITGAVGLYTVYESMKSISDEGFNLANSLGLAFGSLTTIMSGIEIGAIFGGWGPVIGGIAGAIAVLVGAMSGYQTEAKKMIEESENALKKSEDYIQSCKDKKQAIEDSMNSQLIELGYYERLATELENIVDANGRVKKGYEDRASFILNELNNAFGTEYKIIDGTISGYEDLDKSVRKVIESKKAEIILEAERENYINAIKDQTESWKNYNDSIKKGSEINEKYNNLLDKQSEMFDKVGTSAYKNYKYHSELTGQVYQGHNAYLQIQKDLDTYDELLINNSKTTQNYRDQFESATSDIVMFENLQTAVLTNDTEKQKKAIDERTRALITGKEDAEKTLSNEIQFYKDVGDKKIAILGDVDDKAKESAYAQYKATLDSLVSQTKTIEELTPELVNAWGTLAYQDEQEFLRRFKELPTHLQEEVVNKMYSKGYSISEELQKGISKITPTVKVKANVEDAKNAISGFISQISSTLTTTLNVLFKKANGGAFYNGQWHNIEQYANGGAPSHGSVFVAGEAGTEMVGHINGRTEVLNQSQMASVMYNAVASAMANQSASKIELYAHTDDGVIIDRINQVTKQTGVCPINIPY